MNKGGDATDQNNGNNKNNNDNELTDGALDSIVTEPLDNQQEINLESEIMQTSIARWGERCDNVNVPALGVTEDSFLGPTQPAPALQQQQQQQQQHRNFAATNQAFGSLGARFVAPPYNLGNRNNNGWPPYFFCSNCGTCQPSMACGYTWCMPNSNNMMLPWISVFPHPLQQQSPVPSIVPTGAGAALPGTDICRSQGARSPARPSSIGADYRSICSRCGRLSEHHIHCRMNQECVYDKCGLCGRLESDHVPGRFGSNCCFRFG